MFICSNCDHEYKSKGGLTRHINSKKCNRFIYLNESLFSVGLNNIFSNVSQSYFRLQ